MILFGVLSYILYFCHQITYLSIFTTMIIPSMTYEEMVAEFNRDFKQNVEPAYKHYFGKYQQYEHFAKRYKLEKKYYFPMHEYDSKDHNHYIVSFSFNGRSGYKKTGIKGSIFLTYRDRNGNVAAMNSRDNTSTFWTQHFFERYRLRALKDESIPLNEVMKIFFKNISYASYHSVYAPKHKDCVYGMLEDGICLCELISKEPYIFLVKTFISNEMIKEGQYDEYSYLQHMALNAENNDNRPDYIKRHEKIHKDDQLFYGKPIVIPKTNDIKASIYEAIKTDDLVMLTKEVDSDLKLDDYFLSDAEERRSRISNYIKKQRKNGNNLPMCFAPLVFRSKKGYPYYVANLTSWQNNINMELVYTFIENEGAIYLTTQLKTGPTFGTTILLDLEILEYYRSVYKGLSDWRIEDVVIPFLMRVDFDPKEKDYINKKVIMETSFCKVELSMISESTGMLKLMK